MSAATANPELTVADLRATLPPTPLGRPISRSAIYTWIRRGLRGTRLPAFRVGRHLYVYQLDLEEFLRQTNSQATTSESKITAGCRLRAARMRLNSKGIKTG